jgi:cytochrome c-type biogenesis protein CcmE
VSEASGGPDEDQKPEEAVELTRRRKFLAGGLVIVSAIAYLIWSGVSQSVVYFVTPSELLAAPVANKTYRLGGLVLPGSLTWDAKSLALSFTLSDGKAQVPVRHRGAPPDLFAEGRGAVVEGAWAREGYFQASLILAKHSEEYKAPHDGADPGYKELIRTLRRERRTDEKAPR